jgi:glycosyltransferase involved in cell wall biosynthesis
MDRGKGFPLISRFEYLSQIVLNQLMKVSVLIPTYNSQKYLRECLESVVMQDMTNMEILISDDGSTDGTLDLIKTFAQRDARITWWQNPKNQGFFRNHNYCLQRAEGDYIKFVHPDDKLLTPDAIRKMAEVLDHYPGVVMVGGEQHLTGTKSRPTVFSGRAGVYGGRRMMVACWEQNTNLIGQLSLVLFRRQAAGRGFDERFIGHMDYEFSFHLLEQGDFYYIAEPLATWRVHETQQTARLNQDGTAAREHLQFLETYFGKSWVKQAATARMLFTQIHYLEKKYGKSASHLTSAMRSQLSQGQFAREWLRHRIARPIQKLKRKVARRG